MRASRRGGSARTRRRRRRRRLLRSRELAKRNARPPVREGKKKWIDRSVSPSGWASAVASDTRGTVRERSSLPHERRQALAPAGVSGFTASGLLLARARECVRATLVCVCVRFAKWTGRIGDLPIVVPRARARAKLCPRGFQRRARWRRGSMKGVAKSRSLLIAKTRGSLPSIVSRFDRQSRIARE